MSTDSAIEPGFLSDLGLDQVEADPNFLPNSKYAGYLYDIKVVKFKDTTKGKALVFVYKVSDGDHKGKTIDEFKSANSFDEPSKKSWLKQRLLSLGVNEAEINNVDLASLKGKAVWFTTKQNGEYRNVTSVELRDDSVEVASSPASGSVTDLL